MLHYKKKFLVHFFFIYVIDLYFDKYLIEIGYEYVIVLGYVCIVFVEHFNIQTYVI